MQGRDLILATITGTDSASSSELRPRSQEGRDVIISVSKVGGVSSTRIFHKERARHQRPVISDFQFDPCVSGEKLLSSSEPCESLIRRTIAMNT